MDGDLDELQLNTGFLQSPGVNYSGIMCMLCSNEGHMLETEREEE